MIYIVIYDDDLCYRKESYFFDFNHAKRWCQLNRHNWMRWKIKDEKGHEKYGGCNGQSYNGM